MQAASSQLLLSSGVSTRQFDTSRPAEAAVPVPLLAEYAATWLESISGLVRPRTYEGYTYRLEQHILPRLGERRLDEISVDDVLALIGSLRDRATPAGRSGPSSPRFRGSSRTRSGGM